MKKSITIFAGSLFAALLVYAVLTGSELLLPAALPLFLATVSNYLRVQFLSSNPSESLSGKSAHFTLMALSVISAASALLTPLYFPALAEALGWTQYFDGDFVRVMINDMRETGYITSGILTFNILTTLILRFGLKKSFISSAQ